jgi:hypothetical protein
VTTLIKQADGEGGWCGEQVYTRLSERMGLSDHLMVLNITVSKIATNLKCFAACDEVVEMTLNLFQDLASGYMSGKLLLKLESINFILGHHTHEHFPFLDPPVNTRNRTIFYATLGRLLFMEDTPSKFNAFMAPLTAVCNNLASVAGDVNAFRSPQVRTPPREGKKERERKKKRDRLLVHCCVSPLEAAPHAAPIKEVLTFYQKLSLLPAQRPVYLVVF